MRSQSRDHDDQDDSRHRRGRRSSSSISGAAADAGSQRARSLSLGAERRYGDWARSSVQHLLRQDGWLGVRSPPRPTGSSNTAGEPSSSGHSKVGSKDQRRRRAAPEKAIQQTGRPRSSPGGRALNPSKHRDGPGPVARNSARHPAQTRERRASPYATDADFSSAASRLPAGGGGAGSGVAGRPRNSLSRTHPRTAVVVDARARHSVPEGWGNTVTGCGGGGRAGGEFSPTLRWGESMRLPQESTGRQQVARKGQAGAPPSSGPKAASKLSFL